MPYIEDKLAAIDTVIRAQLQDVLEAWRKTPPAGTGATSPAELGEALGQCLDVLQRAGEDADGGRELAADEMSELGDYGLTLVDDLAAWANQLSLADANRALREIVPGLALWIARHGGRLHTLELLVDTLAHTANREQEPDQLAELCGEMAEIAAAVADPVAADMDKSNPGRPWRVFLINYCIVATRSSRPDTMRAAFDTLVRYLPEEAPRFFTEGMEQMDIVGYPRPVRDVMSEYHGQWAQRTLH